MMLKACGVGPTQLNLILQSLQHRLPTTEADFEQMLAIMRRMGHVNECSQGNIGSLFGNHGGRGHYMMFPSFETNDATDDHSSWLGTVPERQGQPQQMYPATSQQWYPQQAPPAQQAYQAAPQERIDSAPTPTLHRPTDPWTIMQRIYVGLLRTSGRASSLAVSKAQVKVAQTHAQTYQKSSPLRQTSIQMKVGWQRSFSIWFPGRDG